MTYPNVLELNKLSVLALGCALLGACGNNSDSGGAGGAAPTGSTASATSATSAASATSATSATSAASSTSVSAGGSTTGTGGQMPYACAPVKATAALITDFSDYDPTTFTWGKAPALTGGTFTYPLAITATGGPPATSLTVSGMVADYSGFGLYFDPCVDASSYQGITFTLGASVETGSMMTFSILTSSTLPIDAQNMRGECPYTSEALKYLECVYPGLSITLPAVAGPISVLWSDFDKKPTSKPPETGAKASSEILGFQWAFTWGAGTAPYAANATLSNVTFM